MADTNALTEAGGQFIQTIFSGILWFGLAIIVIGVIGFVGWWFLIYKRKFNIIVKIVSERAGDKNRVMFDKAAILKDRKDGSYYFRLWGIKKDLPSPKFNVLQSSLSGDYLELFRTAENTFYFLTPPIIRKGEIIKEDGKKYLIGTQENTKIDPNMEFWSVKRKTSNKSMFDKEKIWMKILPYLPQIFGGIITIFVLYILMSYLPNILSELKSLVTELNVYRSADVVTGVWWPLI